MGPRFIPAPLLLSLLFVAATLKTLAVVPDHTWVGAGGNGNVINVANWGLAGGIPSGLGGNLLFGAAPITTVEIKSSDLTALLLGTTLTVNNLTFTTADNYTFTGVGLPTLKLLGDLSTQAANAVTFNDSLILELGAGARRIDLAANSHVMVASVITGAGSLDKEGSGTLSFSGSASYAGGTLVQAGKLELTTGGSITHATADTTVAQGTNFAHLKIDAGASLSSQQTHIGVVAEGNGLVEVRGAGASLTNTGYLYVGEAGTGTMYVSDGASLSSANTSIGNNAGGTGYLYVDGSGTTVTNTSHLYVGSAGSGGLSVENGAVVTNASGVIGNNLGGSGVAGVADSGSHWNNTTDLIVGGAGSGILAVYDAGKVSVNGGAGTITLGSNATGTGYLLLGDTGSAAGVLNAATVTTGAGSGGILFFSTGTSESPYHFTRDGTSAGTPVVVSGTTEMAFLGGYNVVGATSNYTGETTIAESTVVADSRGGTTSNQLGTGAVSLSSGATLVLQNTYLGNSSISVGSGAKLTGAGGIMTGSGAATTIFSGGTLAPGLSGASAVGQLGFDDLTLKGGGSLEWNLMNPDGYPGSGWDLAYIANYSATLHVHSSATAATPFTLKLISLDANGDPGMATGFLNQTYTWEIFNGGPANIDFAGSTVFDPSAFSIDSSQFTTNIGGGSFSLVHNLGSSTLSLQFTPVPEPSTYALMALGLGLISLTVWRRRRTSL